MSDKIFTFEGVETIRIFKFKSKKLGLDFHVVRKEDLEYSATMPLTMEEFKLLQQHKDPYEIMKAKSYFRAENLREKKEGDPRLL